MISKHDLERLIERRDGDAPVLSLYLDMSVNSDNKRTHQIFLSQRRAQLEELGSGTDSFDRASANSVLDRAQEWLDGEFDEENRGVVIFAEIGGPWFEALQFPVAVQNRMVVAGRPVLAPLVQVIEEYHHHGVVLLDREHVRILSVYLGTLLDEIEVHGEPYPAAHDVQAGGYSQQRYQRRKMEEMKHFFREFGKEIEEFVRRYHPDDLVILGTDENVAKFREFLPERLQEMVIYTGPMPVDEPSAGVLQKLEPHLQAERERETREAVDRVRDRVRHDYLATAGYQGTLMALQEGKVDTLVLARGQEREGVRCAQCGFVFAREVKTCPYDGSDTVVGVDVVEELVRMAEGQGVTIEFVDPGAVSDMKGVGALLRY